MSAARRPIVGEPAPNFACHAIVDGSIKDVSLDTYTDSNHWLVLIFFPKAWSFICPTEIGSFSSRLEEFLYNRTCAVAFASTDSEFCLRAWNNTSELEGGLGNCHIPLLSDGNHKVSKAYGVLNEHEGSSQRALFIIDPKGILRFMSINDIDVGRSVDEVLRTVDALAFKDEYGEGCPVNWQKGDKGIDIASRSKVEGPVEIEARKSWTEWARPKLQRVSSGTSQRSTQFMKLMTSSTGSRMPSNEAPGLPTLASFETVRHSPQQRPHSMYLSPLSTLSGMTSVHMEKQIDEALSNMSMEQLDLDNERAAIVNRAVGAAL